MNEQLQAQITQILSQIMVSVGEVKDFSVAQLPDIAQQYITYGLWSNAFQAVFLGLVVIVCIGLGWSIIKYSIKNEDNKDEEGLFFAISIPGAFGIIAFFIFINKIHHLIMILTAPKVWFLLELKNLLS
jgi:hypothetical protein